jgi:hypothetical protein
MASKRRLAQLDFDPIERLVNLYKELDEEIRYMRDLRDFKVPSHITAEGEELKPPRYSAVALAAILAQKEKVANDLLRYGYGRVPETVNINETQNSPLVIQLTDGEKIKVNEIEDGSFEELVDDD